MIDWATRFPGINFLEIQKRIIEDNRLWTGIFLGTGVGKTLPTLVLAEGGTLVVCPKQQMLDRTWERNAEKFGLRRDLTVINYDMFWRKWEEYGAYDTVILDEGHRALGVTPDTRQRNKVLIPKASNTFEAVYAYLQRHRPRRFYVCTATPGSKPMKVWALAKLFGRNWDFFKFRETFCFPITKGRRQIWMARTDAASQQRLALAVQKLGYTGSLQDFVDVPEQTHVTVEVALTDDQKREARALAQEEADPMVARALLRAVENGVRYSREVVAAEGKTATLARVARTFESGKIERILEYAEEFGKLVVFAAYTAQVESIAAALREAGHEVRTVTGATKDRGTVFQELEAAPAGVAVVASQICEGYRVPSAPCVVFASKSNQFLHFEQGKGRILDSQHLKKNLYVHLVVPGGADESCHDAIMSGVDFQERLSVL
jgi:superfamily II DNA or RNA helicase